MDKTKFITIAIISSITILVILLTKRKSGKHYEVSKKIRLFPFWVKYLGIVISIASILMNWKNLSSEPTILNNFGQLGIGIGLLIIALSKERNEDEMTMAIRLNSIFISFFMGILTHFIFILIGIFYGRDFNSFNSLNITSYILYIYLFYFHFKKNRMLK